MKHILLLALLAGVANAAEPDYRLELVRESLTGTHFRYRQYIDGVATDEVKVVSEPRSLTAQSLVTAGEPPALLRIDGRVARRVIVEEAPRQPWLHFYDVESGALLRRVPHFYNAKPARVFDPNPVVATNDPSLRDQNDAASAVPASAYRNVELEGVRGPFAQIVDRQPPNIPPVPDSAASLVFDRSQSGFEDVNAYFHINRTQEYLQSLGYTGARLIAPYSLEVDTHAANGADDSAFLPSATAAGRGVLYFGTGGVDDAEDADLVVHEYGHAIHEWIAPGTFLGTFASEARALSEGFGDYWAFSQHYAQRKASGRDPFCFADWDARCAGSDNCAYGANADCLRRLDSPRTMLQYQRGDTSGVEHTNGAIWSAALKDLFLASVAAHGLAEGKRITDTLVIESLFGLPPNPTFNTMALRMLAVDRQLYGARNTAAISAAMAQRAISVTADYDPQGKVLHAQSVERGVPIPDNNPEGIVSRVDVRENSVLRSLQVRVDIDHSARGDLRLILTAPDGRLFLLKQISLDRAPGIHATYGYDATPADPLDSLAGTSTQGLWTLRVADQRALDTGTLQSWSLVMQLEKPLGGGGPVRIIPLVTRDRAENGLEYRTQLRLLSFGGAAHAAVTFLPSGPNPSPRTVVVEVNGTAVFDDVLDQLFRTTGSGKLLISGAAATSRTWTNHGDGTVGMRVSALEERVYLMPFPTTLHLRNTSAQRGRIGMTDVSGRVNQVRITIWDGISGAQLHQQTIPLTANEHRELPVPVTGDTLVVEVRGEHPVIAYGVNFNTATGDPMYIRPTKLEAIPAISARGANGTFWRTDVTITRTDRNTERYWIPIIFYNAVTGETMRTVVGDPELHLTLHFPDIVATLFERPGHWGRLEIGLTPGLEGYARMTSDGTQTSLPGFQMLSGVDAGLSAIENNQRFRTNIGVYADINGPVTIEIRDASGQVVETRVLEAREKRLITFPVTARVTNGYAIGRIEGGAVRVYASVIDNYTGDALTD